ncbi:MAG: DNA mismatch repair protein MutS [bacterium]|nr:DNA mismatch repair protein MutS [bacterium]
MESTSKPHQTYMARMAQHQTVAKDCARKAGRIANLRLLVFAVIVAAVWGGFALSWASPFWAVIPLALFVALVIAHDRVLRAQARAEAGMAFYGAGLRRLEGTWPGQGNAGTHVAPDEHLYAKDLDLFGEGSLFELICMARTRSGEQALAAWMCTPADRGTMLARREAVDELRDNLDLREELALHGRVVEAQVAPSFLAAWAGGDPVLSWRLWRWVAWAGTGAMLFGFIALALTDWAGPLLLAVGAQAALWIGLKNRVGRVARETSEPLRELEVLAGVLARLEQESFQCDPLTRLHARFWDGNVPASQRIARLKRRIEWSEAHANLLFALGSMTVLGWLHAACALERWRTEWGPRVSDWLQALGELEALSSVAGYAFERPDDAPVEVVEEGPVFDATALGHPLLPPSQCVRNDVRLDTGLRLLVVSGANMSGKSTLLRAVGINVVLAYLGAPACAEGLRVSPLSMGATIRVEDSIRKGMSRFYAEIVRLRDMHVQAGKGPLLFLLDEILHGTNSHDRTIGAGALMSGFVDAGAIGLVTTHDLAVTRIAGTLQGQAANVHFGDRFEDGEIRFDYRLKPGVVSQGNALNLMRSIGLRI